MTMTAIAIDPGGTTGLAFSGYGTTLAGSRERTDTFVMLEELELRAADLGPYLTFVVEEYKITARTAKLSQQHTALEIIGCIRYFCHKYECELVLQRPGDAKRFATDRRLKQAGFWQKGGGGHANDAARHLFVWMCKNGQLSATEVDKRAC